MLLKLPSVLAPNDPAPPPPTAGDPPDRSITFQDTPVRFAIVNDTLFLSAADVCRALKLRVGGKFTPARYTSCLPEAERGYQLLPSRPHGAPQRCAVISLAGAIALTHRRERRRDQQVRAWLKREAAHLQPGTTSIG